MQKIHKSRALFPIVSRVSTLRHANFSIRLNTSDCLVMCAVSVCVLRVLESHKINFMCLLSAHVSFEAAAAASYFLLHFLIKLVVIFFFFRFVYVCQCAMDFS